MTPSTDSPPATRVFLRDDDIGELTPELRGFVGLFASAGLPVSYQIIPERLTPECASFLLEAKRSTPELIEFGQHGLRHEMTVRGKHFNHEFGPQRSYAQQLADIMEGRSILAERLGPLEPIRVFTPPRHRYNRHTLRAIQECGFEVFSASSYTTTKHRIAYACARLLGLTNLGPPGVPRHGRMRPEVPLFELSIAVGVDNGHVPEGSVESILSHIQQARRHTTELGVMFHHQAHPGDAGAAFLRELVVGLRELPSVTFHTIGDLHTRIIGPAGRT